MTDHKNEGMAAIWGGPTVPEMKPISEIMAEARAAGIVIEGTEDISDLVAKPESAAAIYARYNGKEVPSGDEDLVPKPESSEMVWARFNGKLKTGKAA